MVRLTDDFRLLGGPRAPGATRDRMYGWAAHRPIPYAADFVFLFDLGGVLHEYQPSHFSFAWQDSVVETAGARDLIR